MDPVARDSELFLDDIEARGWLMVTGDKNE
jgi:hypothetical protein